MTLPQTCRLGNRMLVQEPGFYSLVFTVQSHFILSSRSVKTGCWKVKSHCSCSNSQKPILEPYGLIVRRINLVAVVSVGFMLEYVQT